MPFPVLTFSLLVFTLFAWFFTLVDISRNEFSGSNKASWLLLTVFLPVVGIVLYLSLGRKHRVDKGGWGTSANIAGLITVPIVAATVLIYRFLLGQDLP
ncbi:PLD nuclease N-terminal domain-containing protein [Geomonas sp. RF6]|uniref:PLD nuclease N-terminal domain-containing protein n=1 Tax=Geomonas sp. RF6 TaxID=2897342 RepID=UPI001E292BFD|nr:PLD nuclease N-terminal domain-containing protein [Geomonas sp. RF6]UFS68923.1 PLD nuclease N-terminal domain-containing protein [Geomonas sp. RF6]